MTTGTRLLFAAMKLALASLACVLLGWMGAAVLVAGAMGGCVVVALVID